MKNTWNSWNFSSLPFLKSSAEVPLVQWVCAISVNSACSTCNYSANSANLKAVHLISVSLFSAGLPFNEAFSALSIWVRTDTCQLCMYSALVSLPCNQATYKVSIRRKPFYFVLSSLFQVQGIHSARKSPWSNRQLWAGESLGDKRNICAKYEISRCVKFGWDKSAGSQVTDFMPGGNANPVSVCLT